MSLLDVQPYAEEVAGVVAEVGAGLVGLALFIYSFIYLFVLKLLN